MIKIIMISQNESYSIKEIKKLDTKGLQRASEDIRNYLIESISNTGGHIGANLGTINCLWPYTMYLIRQEIYLYLILVIQDIHIRY